MEDQIRTTNNWIYKTKKSNLDLPSGPVVQWIEPLSLYDSRWALSEDSSFNSYLSRPEGYLVKTWCDRQQLWKAVITGDTVTAFLSEVMVNHLKVARGEICLKRNEKNNKKLWRWEQKSAIKLILKDMCCLAVGWLFGFYGTSTFVCYLMLNPFLYKNSVLFQ